MKIIVFDDDPTGSQTVHSCTLLLQWDKDQLVNAIKNNSLLFILANTRSLTTDLAEKRTREICQVLLSSLKENKLLLEDVFIVSRGDSTLRGHGFLEPNTINKELGPFDGTFHIPAFFEGGRLTIKGIHLLNNIPVHKTSFAEDKIFGYSTSFLPDWLEEKSNGQIKADNVNILSIDKLENARNSYEGMKALIKELSMLSSNQPVIVDATETSHLDTLCYAVKKLKGKKRFLFRSSASFINSLANIRSDINKGKEFLFLSSPVIKSEIKPGLIIVGSYVPLANKQLKVLLRQEECLGVQLPVKKVLQIFEEQISEELILNFEKILIDKINNILNQNKTPVFYTSREELEFSSQLNRMEFGNFLANFMAKVASKVVDRLGYIISKGGITTNNLLTEGFKAKYINLKGQIMPGLSLVCLPKKTFKTEFPIITFPGNLGDQDTLCKAWKIMESKLEHSSYLESINN